MTQPVRAAYYFSLNSGVSFRGAACWSEPLAARRLSSSRLAMWWLGFGHERMIALRDRQRWPQQLHPMCAPQFRILGWHGVGLGDFTEECFHVPSRQKRD